MIFFCEQPIYTFGHFNAKNSLVIEHTPQMYTCSSMTSRWWLMLAEVSQFSVRPLNVDVFKTIDLRESLELKGNSASGIGTVVTVVELVELC